MPIKRRTPGGGGPSRTDSFSYDRTLTDKPWWGWLAGEPVWIVGHLENRPTKICVDWATDGKVPCWRCGPRAILEDIAYVPIYRESDGAPILVIVYDNSYDFLVKCKHLDYVRVVREGADTERVTVQKNLHQKKYVTSLKRRQTPVDLSEDLVRMWDLNEYTEWYNCQPGNKPVPAKKGKPVKANTKGEVTVTLEQADMLERTAKQTEDTKAAKPVGSLTERYLSRLAGKDVVVTQNGKPHAS
jgi:hypothetical protein